MSSRTRLFGWVVFCGVLIGLGSADLAAQTPTLLGARAGVYADGKDGFVGGEFLTPLVGRFYFNPNAEYVFVENSTAATFNFDFHYDFPLGRKAFTWERS